MFYSHEILNSRQYGVATIWLVATWGQSGSKRVSKKAIQDVDLARACEKILQPGAPIALRLQSSLLYGVSKVYQQKCHYMLTDLQKVQGHMATFLRSFGANQLNPEEIRARSEQLMIMDDPDFFPDGNIVMPDPTADMFILGPNSNKTSSQSQMSPHTSQSTTSSSGKGQFPFHLDLPESSVSGSQPVPHLLQGLSSARTPKSIGGNDNLFDEDIGGLMDFGIDIDENGNVVELEDPRLTILDEPDLPPMTAVQVPEDALANQQPQLDEHGDIFMVDEQALPEAIALPVRQPEVLAAAGVAGSQSEQSAPAQRRRKHKVICRDADIEIHRSDLQAWQNEYLGNCTSRPHLVTTAQAKKNAMLLTFGLGIGNIGQNLGIPNVIHPLAGEFSGDALFTAYTGLTILDKTNRKRTISAAELVEDREQERRVRPRLERGSKRKDCGIEVDDLIEFGQQQDSPEVAREVQPALDDHLSSAMPWNNRGSSLVPGSSIQKGNSVHHGREQSSPLGGRSNTLGIIRYSSDADQGGMDFDAGGFQSNDSAFDGMLPPTNSDTAAADVQMTAQTEDRNTREALDRDGKNFLGFIEETIRTNGERRHDKDVDLQRKWIEFNDVFVPANTDSATAAQAFYHILTLVTKGQMVVEQDNEGKEPFGNIHVGVKLPHGA